MSVHLDGPALTPEDEAHGVEIKRDVIRDAVTRLNEHRAELIAERDRNFFGPGLAEWRARCVELGHVWHAAACRVCGATREPQGEAADSALRKSLVDALGYAARAYATPEQRIAVLDAIVSVARQADAARVAKPQLKA